MDHFLEEVVVKRKPFMQNLAHVFSNIFMIISAIMGVFYLQVIFMQFNIVVLIMTVLFLGMAILLFRFFSVGAFVGLLAAIVAIIFLASGLRKKK